MPVILVVDDDPLIRNLVTDVLEGRGHQVLSAIDGPQGLKMAQAKMPDLIILDVDMPGLNGFEVCARIRKDAKTRGLRILMLTARVKEADSTRGLDSGADAYLSKPFNVGEIEARVQLLLGLAP